MVISILNNSILIYQQLDKLKLTLNNKNVCMLLYFLLNKDKEISYFKQNVKSNYCRPNLK